MRDFQVVSREGEQIGSYLASTPRGAAIKVAARSQDRLIILFEKETGRLHAFEGETRLLTDAEHTNFTRAHNISCKANVRKLAYCGLTDGTALGERIARMLGNE